MTVIQIDLNGLITFAMIIAVVCSLAILVTGYVRDDDRRANVYAIIAIAAIMVVTIVVVAALKSANLPKG